MNKTIAFISAFLIAIGGSLLQDVMAQNNNLLEMGVNVNERPHWLKSDMLEQTQTTWTRAFIEASHYIKGDRSLDDDFRIKALHRVADEDYKVIVSIKWDLKEADWSVPEPGSDQEQQWLKFAEDLLDELGGKLDKLVLVNELTIDTPEEDLQPNQEGVIPFVRFQKRLLDHVSSLKPKGADGKPLPIYAGGFTRLDQKKQQEHPANRAVIEWVNEDDRLAGANFHIHQPDYKTTVEAVKFAREAIPEKSLITTEFSLVWKWRSHLGDEIGKTDAGEKFAQEYDLDPKMTIAEYSTHIFANPVSYKEWKDFLKSQPWYEPDYLDVMGRLLENYGVDVATYAFTQNPNRDRNPKFSETSTPWYIHQILMPQVIRSESDKTPVNYGMFDSFVRWQRVTDILNSSEKE